MPIFILNTLHEETGSYELDAIFIEGVEVVRVFEAGTEVPLCVVAVANLRIGPFDHVCGETLICASLEDDLKPGFGLLSRTIEYLGQTSGMDVANGDLEL